MRRALLLAALALACVAPAAAAGPPERATYTPLTSPSGVSWTVGGIPDLDQLRALGDPAIPGLPNDGRNHCAPTSSADVLAFLATRGFRTGVDGRVDYAAPESYAAGVAEIDDLAVEMGTNSSTGTTMPAYTAVLRSRTAGASVLRSIQVDSVRYHGGEQLRTPSLREFAEVGLSGGVMVGTFGWYTTATDSTGSYLQRTGGHAIALTHVEATRPGYRNGAIAFRDPWTAAVLDRVQSPYADGTHTVQRQTLRVQHPDTGTIVDAIDLIAMTDRAGGYLEGYVALAPQRYWLADGNRLVRITPEPLLPGDPADERVTVSDGIMDVTLSPRTGLPTVLGRKGAIRRIGAGAKGERLADDLVATIKGATAIAEGRHGELYAAAGASLVRLAADVERQTVKTPASIIDLVVTEAGIAALAADGRRVLLYDEQLQATGQRRLAKAATGLDVGAKGELVARSTSGGAPALRDDAGRLVALAGGRLTVGGKAVVKGGKGLGGTLVAVDRSADIYDRGFYAKPFDTTIDEPEKAPPPLQPAPKP